MNNAKIGTMAFNPFKPSELVSLSCGGVLGVLHWKGPRETPELSKLLYEIDPDLLYAADIAFSSDGSIMAITITTEHNDKSCFSSLVHFWSTRDWQRQFTLHIPDAGYSTTTWNMLIVVPRVFFHPSAEERAFAVVTQLGVRLIHYTMDIDNNTTFENAKSAINGVTELERIPVDNFRNSDV